MNPLQTLPRPSPRVMVVDDDRAFRETLRDLLAEDGFTVVGEASDGAEAAGLAEQLKPDVIVMDLRMPRVDGIEGTRLVKTILPLVQVIMLSAYEDPGLQRGAEAAGVYCYLIKGCPPDMIRQMLEFAWNYKLSLERIGGTLSPDSLAEGLRHDDIDPQFGLHPGS